MKKFLLSPLFALSMLVAGCADTGIMSPEDSAQVRADAGKVVKLLRTFDAIAGLAITEATNFCAVAGNEIKFPCNTGAVGTAKEVSDKIGVHLAKLDAALGDATTDTELFVTLSRQGWELYGDILDSVNKLRGVSPAARTIAPE